MKIRVDQVQSLVFGGLGRHSASSILALRWGDCDRHATLAELFQLVGFGLEARHKTELIQVALTPCGLRNIGTEVDIFPFAFQTPLGSDYHKRLLGDTENSDPQRWKWNGDDCDLIVFCYAGSDAGLQNLESRVTATSQLVHRVTMEILDENKEHFGFRDGITNPRVTDVWEKNDLPLGEFVLGYPNLTNEVPTVSFENGVDFGKDGTYLVVRQLAQNVPLFWQTLRSQHGDPIELGAKLIGRWPDGQPLADDETFEKDLAGWQCPIGAHIRRANPRKSFVSLGRKPIDLSRHRLLRRGRPYGLPCPPDVYPEGVKVTSKNGHSTRDDERGLVFACLGADIARQFEHIQQSWLNNAKHNGLRDEVCPITSATHTKGDKRSFTIPGLPVRRRIHQWPEVVEVKGSAYCFMPGREAFEILIEQRRGIALRRLEQR